MSAERRPTAARFAIGAAVVAGSLAVWALAAGGFRVHVFGVPLSMRGADRPAVIALACLAIALYLDERLRRRLGSVRRQFSAPCVLFTTVTLAAGAVLWIGVTLGPRAIGGSDAYGYVSQMDLWRHGNLRIRQDFAASVPWPNAEWTFAPLGYRPGDNHTIVPTYPPGLPLLMLLSSLIFGGTGTYIVPPICAAALVLLTYALGVRVSSRAAGATAALCVATSPTVLVMTLSTMADVPAAAFWTASLLLACRHTQAASFGAGAAAGMAIVIRPNLVGLSVIPALIALWNAEDRHWRHWARRLAAFAAGAAPFALFLGWLFDDLYGSPLRSGYGDTGALFAWSHLPTNLARYPRWLWETQGPLVFLFVLGPFVAPRQEGDRFVRIALLAFVLVAYASYLLYTPFDAWWWLRFLLPAFPAIFLLCADSVWSATRRAGPPLRNLAMVLLAVTMLSFGATNAWQRDVFEAGRGELKYAEVGNYVRERLPLNAVVYTVQHSGTVRYYAGRLTLNYSWLEGEWLDRSVEHLQRAGYEPFFLLEDWEVPAFRDRFTSQNHVALVDREPPHAPCMHTTYMYRVVPRPGLPPSERIPRILGCP